MAPTTPMTEAEKERSQRVCEILGTAACALLTWPVACSLMETWAANDSVLDDIPSSFIVGFVVFMSYIGVFVILDRWRTKHCASKTGGERVNWLLIPFAGAFFSFLNSYLAAPQIRAFAGVANWMSETLMFSLIWGTLMVCVMFCFWVFGYALRGTREKFSARP